MNKMLYRLLKNFVNKPATRLYPASIRKPFERTRGRIYFEQENCIYCGICQKRCPSDAIKVDKQSTTWELDAFRCIICGECVNVCPKKCIKMLNERRSCSNKKKTVKLARQSKNAE